VGEEVESVALVSMDGLSEELAEVVTNKRGFYIRPDGDVVPSHLLPELERTAYQGRYGRLTPDLYDQVSDLGDQERVPVYILVSGDYLMPELSEVEPDDAVSGDAFTEWVATQRALQAERITAAKEPVLGILGDDAEVGDSLDYLPIIEADVPAATLRSIALNTSDAVVSVMPHDTPAQLLGYAGHSSMKIPSLVGGTCGPAPQGPPASSCGGAGLPVGIWERDENVLINSAVNTRNNRLNHGANGDTYLRTPTSCNGDSECPDTHLFEGSSIITNKRKCINARCVEEHVTYVAGSLGMVGTFDYASDSCPNTPDSFGNSGLWDVRYKVGNDNGPSGLDYITGQSAVYVNRSSTLTLVARKAADFAGQYNGVFLTVAGGNDGSGVDVLCGEFRNGLCVGGFRYETYSSTSTHRWWLGSNDHNKIANLERPHILGPASFHDNGNGLALPDINADGTSTMRFGDYNPLMQMCYGQGSPIFGSSFASPGVLATAVLAHQYEGLFSLLGWTQVTKAVILSGSIDSNQDGALGLSNSSWSLSGDAKDGAGHPDMSVVKALLDGNQYFGRDMANSDFVSCGAGCREYVVASNVTLPLTKSAKVALAWSACSLSSGSDALMANDLDLAVTRTCNGTPTTFTSNTIPSETEMVFLSCGAQAGSMTIRIRIKNGATLAACGTRTTERVGVAWSFQ
jgi:hypothetical protein